MERAYKNETDFKDFTKSMSDAQFKHNMKTIAYLLPPRQRTISRFINLSNWVNWAHRMLEVYHTLSKEEKDVFSFVPSNASFIKELEEVISCINFIEKECKHTGLSKYTVAKCQKQIRTVMLQGNSRMHKLGMAIYGFLSEEAALLESDSESHNNSSDILESTFGIFKKRKSPNKLYGVTPLILFLPVYTRVAHVKNTKNNYNFKEHLEKLRVWQINEWTNTHLPKNLVVKRKLKLTTAS